MSYTDILTLKGTFAVSLEEKRSSILSPFIVFVASLLYGVSAFYAGDIQSDLVVYLLFAYIHMVASQVGISLLLWAMCRLFKGTSKFLEVFAAVGYTFIPYGLLMAIHSYYGSISSIIELPALALITIALFLYFIFLLVRVLQLMEGFTQKRALISVFIGLIFFISVIYNFGY